MRLLITGITGFIGSYLSQSTKNNFEVFGTWHHSLHHQFANTNIFRVDITNKKSVCDCIEKTQPDVIVHTAGIRDINFCENHPDVALINHFEGTKNIIDAICGSGTRILYISSDCVFSGKRDFYNENDSPSPVNKYGEAKLMAEEYIVNKYHNHIIIRASLLFGWTLLNQPSNTVQDVVFQSKSTRKVALSNVNYNTPLYIKSAVEIILKLISTDYAGVVHLAGENRLSRFDLGLRTAEVFDLNKNIITPLVKPMPNRPLNSCLSMNIIPQLIQVKPPSLAEGLVAMKQDWKDMIVLR